MKTWLRLILVTVLVGGGFTLFASSVEVLSRTDDPQLMAVGLFVIMIVCSSFITASGLVLVYDPRRTRLARVALALQIPYISSSLFMYKLICGAGLYTVVSLQPIEDLMVVGGHIGIRFQLGGYWSIAIWEGHPSGIGVNWIAILLLMILHRSMRAPSQTVLPVASEPRALDQAKGDPPVRL